MNLPPPHTPLYHGHHRFRNAIVLRYESVKACIAANLSNLGWNKFLATAPLAGAIFHIGVAVAQKQVVRVAARTVVALMQHPKAIWNRAYENLVGDSVGLENTTAIVYLTVPILAHGSGPHPTPSFGVLSYSAQQPIFECYGRIESRHVIPPTRDRCSGCRRDDRLWDARFYFTTTADSTVRF